MLETAKRRAFYISLAISVALVGCLDYVWRYWHSSLALDLLAPGEIVNMIINGPHGGTLVQEEVGSVVSFILNTVVYAAVFVVAYWLWSARRPRSGRAQQT